MLKINNQLATVLRLFREQKSLPIYRAIET